MQICDNFQNPHHDVFRMCSFLLVLLPLHPVLPSTHWVVTESGKIQAQVITKCYHHTMADNPLISSENNSDDNFVLAAGQHLLPPPTTWLCRLYPPGEETRLLISIVVLFQEQRVLETNNLHHELTSIRFATSDRHKVKGSCNWPIKNLCSEAALMRTTMPKYQMLRHSCWQRWSHRTYQMLRLYK